jgi:metal-responsive CopG/Arc/MetJ family transcriptional regulator
MSEQSGQQGEVSDRDLNEEIDAFSDETDDPKSEAIRTLLERGLEYEDMQDKTDELRR